jgi:cellulose biosynthesis protein BcsQ
MVITTSSWKGGTGKTTLNALLARMLAENGKKVLLVDLDANCALSQIFGQIMKDVSALQFLSGTLENFNGVYNAEKNIDIIPSDIKIVRLNNIMDAQLKINLKRTGLIDKYDYIIIDPPGYWGSHARNAVFAADVVVIPATCSRIDFAATQLYFEELQACEIQAEIKICINCFNKRTNLPGIYEEYLSEFGEFIMPYKVPYIASLKKLTDSVHYMLNPLVKKLLQDFINQTIGGHHA